MPKGNTYLIIYKPKGCLSQFSKEHGKMALGDFFDFPKDVYPVGRLDEDSEGLLILSNDKSINSLLLNPKNGHWRTYWVQVQGQINKKAIKEKISSLSRYIDLSPNNFDAFLNWILELRQNLNIPHTLKDLIKENSKFEEMSLMAFNDPSTSSNPIELSIEDFLKLYKDSYEGNLD